MRLGIVQVELSIPWAMSLKDKRQVVKSLKDKLRRKFNVSVAEVADNDLHRTAVIGLAAVGNDPRFLRSVCDKVVEFIENNAGATVEDVEVEIL